MAIFGYGLEFALWLGIFKIEILSSRPRLLPRHRWDRGCCEDVAQRRRAWWILSVPRDGFWGAEDALS